MSYESRRDDVAHEWTLSLFLLFTRNAIIITVAEPCRAMSHTTAFIDEQRATVSI